MARKLLTFVVPGFVFLAVLGLACSGCRPGSAANGGPEDQAIRAVEELGGKCSRVSDLQGEFAPDYLEEVEGNPVVEVKLGGDVVVIRRPSLTEGKEGTETLRCGRAHVTDAALTKFHLLKEIRVLALSDTAVTDEGLKSLGHLRRLRELNLLQTRVTDAGLKELAGFQELWKLSLASTTITDAGMKYVAKLQSLTELELSWTRVGNAGLADLVALPWLRDLHLTGTAITDAGVKQLAKLSSLRYLNLSETKVTMMGAKDLNRALPDCSIWIGTSLVK